MVIINDALQHRRNKFAKGFIAFPVILAGWMLITTVWTTARYGGAEPLSSGPSFWFLALIAFLVPIMLGILLARGHALERLPVLGAVVVLSAIGVFLGLITMGIATVDERSFIELFLAGSLLLGYCVTLLYVKHVPVVLHFAPEADTTPATQIRAAGKKKRSKA